MSDQSETGLQSGSAAPADVLDQVQRLVDRARDPSDSLDADEALRRIGRLTRVDPEDVYQKSLG